ncbi:MAG TPA: glycoside hydrolase family 3 protein [Planctomycetota bacterium]|nr:glycoside hydrolase family 3 protein [Planctomycetota bacterium]
MPLPRVSDLSLHEKAGQVVFPALRLPPAPNHEREGLDHLLRWIEAASPGGIALFGGTAAAVRDALPRAQSASRVPLLVCADFERGAGQQVEGATEFPAFMALGAADDEELARRVGLAVGREARALGVHLNFAPVLDVVSEPLNPIVDTRALGDEPGRVAALGLAFARGLAGAGLLATAKHFPGHGPTTVDSHLALARIEDDLETVERRDLAPFAAAVEAEIPAILVGHLGFPAVERDPDLPATLSKAVASGLLRERMGYGGLVVTDAFTMAAARARFPEEEAAARSLAAGCDVVLYPTDPVATVRRIVEAVGRGELDPRRLDEAAARVLAAKRAAALDRGAGPSDEPVGLEGTRALALEVARRSLTLVGARELRPLLPGRGVRFVLVDDDETEIGPQRFEEAARRIDPSASCHAFAGACGREPADAVVLFTAVRGFRGRPVPGERSIAQVRAALARGNPPLVVLGTPFAAAAAPPGAPRLIAYGFETPSVEAALGCLYGRWNAAGRAPVRIDGARPART